MKRRCGGALHWAALLTLGIGLVLALRIGWVWSALPDTVASHFGAGGRPDAFLAKGPFFAFLAVSAGGSIALVFAAAALVQRIPSRWINVPNRDYWLATDERRASAMNRIATPLAWMGLATTMILAVGVEFTVRANLEQTDFANDTFIVLLVGYLLCVTAITTWMIGSLARLKDTTS